MLLFLYLLSFEAISVLRNHYRQKVHDPESDCMRMCKMKYTNVGGNKSFTIKEMNERLDTTNVIYYLFVN